ncbi:hypothetical protein [Cryptosporangium arvum]|uniref:hypothetical protein n=1 Tax=Cryptosporangium arvum TaxID=80871 RepID=UPI0004AF3F33|nr:hypothetical protein [Cryptosporangium arvum]
MELRPEQGGRGRGVAAVIEGFFGAMWFGWATSDAPGWLLPVLIAGSVAGLAVVVLGVVLAKRSPAGSSPMADPAVRKRYNIIVAIEFGLIFAGAAVLGQVAEDYIAAWIALIVGLHFVPLGRVFAQRLLEVAGWVITAAAIVAGVVALTTDADTSTVAGVGAGTTLVVTGVLTVLGVRVFADRQPVTGS